ncbi:CTLH/CRA C-terminal to lish motif domain-containing protein, partial [Gorgonomyces haynaldii]
ALDTLSARKSLKYLILEGKLSEAVEFFDEHFVDSLETEKEILFALKCQLFIELIKTDTAQALEFAQKDLGQFANVSQKTDDLLQDVLSLIAYPDPQQSPVAHLLTQERREQVADEVNEYIIRSFGLSQQTCVEKIARQATVVRSALHSETSKDKK